ncbi:hypothetical protein OOZ15_04935 [Galbibacter sp. EGI 63066]|uniref:hypothetical protein n=1 Tax=Galbibacter sp. EGI 63066 TaxID=2993559 RepID=UPI002248CAF8|nr:hypothetical protein [Galbibacter sp. EGI 63066]MCX2679280.1 hypothetical protein [Galbibacter sp. EGI 63066]
MRTILLLFILSTAMVSCKQANTMQFDLAKLPKNWVKLTPNKKGKLVIFNPCNGPNMLLSIKEDKKIVFKEGQKDFELDVLETSEVADTVFIKAKWNWTESEKRQNIKFIWTDRQKGIGRWITTYSGGFTTNFSFVTENKQEDFDTIYEPCSVCWGEECDEIKKSEIQAHSN